MLGFIFEQKEFELLLEREQVEDGCILWEGFDFWTVRDLLIPLNVSGCGAVLQINEMGFFKVVLDLPDFCANVIKHLYLHVYVSEYTVTLRFTRHLWIYFTWPFWSVKWSIFEYQKLWHVLSDRDNWLTETSVTTNTIIACTPCIFMMSECCTCGYIMLGPCCLLVYFTCILSSHGSDPGLNNGLFL